MRAEFEKMTLKNLCGGAAAELFDRELESVLQNIADPNTKTKTAREITLKVTVLPTEDRSRGVVGVKCTSKLAPAGELESSVDFVQEGKKQSAYQRSVVDKETGNVTHLGGGRA